MDLYMRGVITSREKTYMPGKWLASFVLGSQELYNFVNKNPMIEIWAAEDVVDPQIASLNNKLVSINTAREVDLSGQCASIPEAFRQYPHTAGKPTLLKPAGSPQGANRLSLSTPPTPTRKARSNPPLYRLLTIL